MKKRVISFLIAMSVLCSETSGGLAVFAEDDLALTPPAQEENSESDPEQQEKIELYMEMHLFLYEGQKSLSFKKLSYKDKDGLPVYYAFRFADPEAETEENKEALKEIYEKISFTITNNDIYNVIIAPEVSERYHIRLDLNALKACFSSEEAYPKMYSQGKETDLVNLEEDPQISTGFKMKDLELRKEDLKEVRPVPPAPDAELVNFDENHVTLKAPEGYEISKDEKKPSDRKKEYEFSISPGQDIFYYLWNCQEDAAENGLSVKKTYSPEHHVYLGVNVRDVISKNYGQSDPDLNASEFYDLTFLDSNVEQVYQIIPDEVRTAFDAFAHEKNLFGREQGEEIGTYNLEFSDQEVFSYTDEEKHIIYHVSCLRNGGSMFKIFQYQSEISLTDENISRSNKKNVAILTAPEGYQVGTEFNKFSEKLEIPVANGENRISYYLKNIDENSDQYNSITTNPQEIVFYYNGTPPTIIPEAIVESQKDNDLLNFLTFGIFSKESVKVTVWARGSERGQIPQDHVNITLTEENQAIDNITLEAEEDASIDSNYYYYKAVFEINKPLSEIQNMHFTAYAESQDFPEASEQINLILVQNQQEIDFQNAMPEKPDLPLMIEDIPPKIEKVESDGYGTSTITVLDHESGLNAFHYFWQTPTRNSQEQTIDFLNLPESVHVLEEENGKITRAQITLEIPPEGMLHAEVVDNALNHSVTEKTDEEGNTIITEEYQEFEIDIQDYAPPEVAGFQIRLAENAVNADENNPSPATINFRKFGIFANTYDLLFQVDASDPDLSNGKTSAKHPLTVFFDANGKKIKYEQKENTSYYIWNDSEKLKKLWESGDHSSYFSVKVHDGRNRTERNISDFQQTEPILIIDTIPPEVRFTDGDNAINYNKPDTAVLQEGASGIWYGIKSQDANDSIGIDISDPISGISEIEIKLNGEDISKQIENFQPNYRESKTEQLSLKIPLFTCNPIQGENKLSVSLTDNAGNKIEQQYVFFVDTNAPSGNITVIEKDSDTKVSFDTNTWYDGDSKIEITFNAEDDHPYYIQWQVNEQESKTEKGSYYQVFLDHGNLYAADDTEMKNPILKNIYDLSNPNQFQIHAVVYDMAQNTNEMKKDPSEQNTETNVLTESFFMDYAQPELTNVTISKASAWEQILNLLTFGIFSNQKVRITATVSESISDGIPPYQDSGFSDDSVEIQLDSKKEYVKMTKVGDHTFIYDIPVDELPDDKVESGAINFRITDHYGVAYLKKQEEAKTNPDKKISEKHQLVTDPAVINRLDEIEDREEGENTDSNAFMLERKTPDIIINLPASDGVQREDGTIWYRSDKQISIDVHDPDSGLRNVSVTVNGIEYLSYSYDKKINEVQHYSFSTDAFIKEYGENEDGSYAVQVTAEDNAGNIKVTDEYFYYIDKINPKVDLINFSIRTADGIQNAAEFISILEYGFYFEKELTANVQVSDAEPSSGLYQVEYRLVEYAGGVRQNEISGAADVSGNVASFTVPANFKGQIFVKVFDYTKNSSDEVTPQSFVIDTPERHESEKHIFFESPEPEYHDVQGNALYSQETTITAIIKDDISGISEFSYSLDSEKEKRDLQKIEIPNKGNFIGQDLGDGWRITDMDENLVTEVTCNYGFSQDNNNIQLHVDMTDRAYNKSSDQSALFSMDLTRPVIIAEMKEASGDDSMGCYNNDREAVITVIDRNVKPEDLKKMVSITNTFKSNIPDIEFEAVEESTYKAELIFDEGDYEISIQGTDLAGHPADVTYQGSHPTSFRVDKENIQFANESAINEAFNSFKKGRDSKNIFNEEKSIEISFKEHNFNASKLHLHVYRAAPGEKFQETKKDCLPELMGETAWTQSGDIHTLNLTFKAGYQYQVVFGDENGMPSDASGRTLTDAQNNLIQQPIASEVFEIDMKNPEVKKKPETPVNVYAKDSDAENPEVIEFEDENIASIKYDMNIYRLIDAEMKVESFKGRTVKGNKVTLDKRFFNSENDGIYELTCVAVDEAGNESEPLTHTYVIQRKADFLAYFPGVTEENEMPGLYVNNVSKEKKGINSNKFSDIVIEAYLLNDDDFSLLIDQDVVPEYEGGEKEGVEILKDSSSINGVTHYTATIRKGYTAEHFAGITGIEEPAISPVCSGKSYTIGHMVIDNKKPDGEYTGISSKTHYYEEKKTITITGVSSDLDIDKCRVELTYNKDGFNKEKKEIILEKDQLLTNQDGTDGPYTISFTLDGGYYDSIKTTLYDYAGNDYKMNAITEIYIGNWFTRWKGLIYGSLGLLLLIGILIFRKIRA